ncbi:MAG: oxidoreductase [bacterium P3]|nr:MAG: oxidoreductase [bacterium P3]KWW42724.1 MAG: oxidoreductase [bacterium F083]
MQTVTLGRSGLVVPKNGFGALPIQRIGEQEAVHLIHKALDGGMYYFDTARFYTDSEQKLGMALRGRRHKAVISTKTGATDAAGFWRDLETSLRLLQTDYVDLYQFHNPAFCPKPDDGSGLYEAMQQAVDQGKVLHVGITNHRLAVASEAIDSGLYETLQFPFSYLASDKEQALVERCRKANIGYIAMKALSGGLITHAATAYAYLAQYPHVEPIWGIQKESELDEFLSFQDNPPVLNDEMRQRIARDRAELTGDFCRGCGYCQPCTVGIEIQDCNRMSLFLKRAPYSVYLTEAFRQKMEVINQCVDCGLCKTRCPYGLDIPTLLRRNYDDFQEHWGRRHELRAEQNSPRS